MQRFELFPIPRKTIEELTSAKETGILTFSANMFEGDEIVGISSKNQLVVLCNIDLEGKIPLSVNCHLIPLETEFDTTFVRRYFGPLYFGPPHACKEMMLCVEVKRT